MPGEAPAPMYCAHMTGDGCELSNCEEHECHLDDREDVEIRMPDPNTEHGLRVQLATALRERDTQKARAEAAEAELSKYRARPYATLAADVRAAEAALAAARRECEGLRKALGAARAVIDRDRTGLAAGLNAAINATHSYWWIANGEWSGHHYTEQNEKTLRAEVKNAFEEIAATAAKALSESGRLASESCRAIDAALAAPATPDEDSK